jgi:hypothetical protein
MSDPLEVKILAGVEGRVEVKQLTDDIEKQEAKIRNLAAAYPGLTHAQMAQIPAIRQEIDALRALQGQYAATQGAVQRYQAVQANANRAGTISRAGFGVANMAQDMIQGGPASGINNAIFMAQDAQMRALAVDAIAAAGGIGTVAAAFGGVAVAAGAAFLLIDHGLKEAKLDWSDLDNVVANTAAWTLLEETITGVGVVINDLGVTWQGAFDAGHAGVNTLTGGMLGYGETAVRVLKDNVLDWTGATEAARQHKEEIGRNTQAYREYGEAAKRVGGVRSEEATGRAKAQTGALANVAPDRTLDEVARDLAKRATVANGQEKVTVGRLDPKTGYEVPEEITKEDQMFRQFVTDLGKAMGGDTAALADLIPKLKQAGYDVEKLTTEIALSSPAYKEAQKAAAGQYDAFLKQRKQEGDDLTKQGKANEAALKAEQAAAEKAEKATDALARSFDKLDATEEKVLRDIDRHIAKQAEHAEKQAKQETETRTGKLAGQFDGAFAGPLMQDMLTGLQKGQKGEDVDRKLTAIVANYLRATSGVNGIKAEDREDVAAKIVAGTRDQFGARMTGVALNGGGGMGMQAPPGMRFDAKGNLRFAKAQGVGGVGGRRRGNPKGKAGAAPPGMANRRPIPAQVPGVKVPKLNMEGPDGAAKAENDLAKKTDDNTKAVADNTKALENLKLYLG